MDTSNLKRFRKYAKLTQEELAEKLNVTRQTVAKWEAGESLPDIDSCIAMSKLYDITVDDLVKYAKDPDSSDAPKGKHIFGVMKVGADRKIKLPQKALDVFGINEGEKLLLLGDEEKGMALVKLKGFIDFKNELLKAIEESEKDEED